MESSGRGQQRDRRQCAAAQTVGLVMEAAARQYRRLICRAANALAMSGSCPTRLFAPQRLYLVVVIKNPT